MPDVFILTLKLVDTSLPDEPKMRSVVVITSISHYKHMLRSKRYNQVDFFFLVFCLSFLPPLPPTLAFRFAPVFFCSSPLTSACCPADFTLTTVDRRLRSSGRAVANACTWACASDQSVPSSMAYLRSERDSQLRCRRVVVLSRIRTWQDPSSQ
jgi:hypothetical protein